MLCDWTQFERCGSYNSPPSLVLLVTPVKDFRARLTPEYFVLKTHERSQSRNIQFKVSFLTSASSFFVCKKFFKWERTMLW